MHLNLLYFAHVRERIGKSGEALELPEGATVADALEALTARYPGLERLLPTLRVAVDAEFADLSQILHDGAEVVLIPPVAGGSGPPLVRVTDEALGVDTADALATAIAGPEHGGVVTFVGRVRDHARGHAVTRLEYEAYGAMAERQLRKLVAEVEAAFPGTRAAVHHRTGLLAIGDVAVVVVTASAHRGDAFDANRRLIDRLKEDVPIWKRETGPDGTEWVSDRP
ncbi:MAG: molybdenum cofactor biosynthesis protein MoaE [Myxococcales bacterium]|nr:molybdenum cofactor biosynthesis protein MoaE [Myxococcales bacterium]